MVQLLLNKAYPLSLVLTLNLQHFTDKPAPGNSCCFFKMLTASQPARLSFKKNGIQRKKRKPGFSLNCYVSDGSKCLWGEEGGKSLTENKWPSGSQQKAENIIGIWHKTGLHTFPFLWWQTLCVLNPVSKKRRGKHTVRSINHHSPELSLSDSTGTTMSLWFVIVLLCLSTTL